MRKVNAFVAMALVAATADQAAIATDSPAALTHVERARVLAGDQFKRSLFLCDPEGIKTLVAVAIKGSEHWLPPTKAFDELFYIGSEFVGVWLLNTGAGLILFDSTGSTADARDHLVPGLQLLGLDPASIRYVIVTHAHWDHFGGAKYLHDTYGARIAMSAEDWKLLGELPVGGIERAPTFGADRSDRTPPRQDMVIHDGYRLTLGKTSVTLYVTPGHTPGTLSALVPVHEGRNRYLLSLLGGTAFPQTLKPTKQSGGLIAFSASIERLSRLSQAAGAVGVLNTHIFADGSTERLAEARARQANQPNPFILGTEAVAHYYAMFDECLKAASERTPAHIDIKALSESIEH